MRNSPFRIAAAAIEIWPGEKVATLEAMRKVCLDLKEESAKLVLFPELSLCGFIPNHPKIEHEPWLREGLRVTRELAEKIPGPSTDGLVSIARETDQLISAGMFEDNGALVHNSQVLVGPEGILSVTRKMHIPMFEAPFYNGGGPPVVVETDLGRIGTAICFDTVLPESTRLLAVQGAELVLMPFASDPDPKNVEGWIENNAPLLQVRCRENGFFGLAVNNVGHVEALGCEMTFPGGGMLIGPDGRLLERWSCETAKPGAMVAEVDPSLLAEARSNPEFGFRFRRPELYRGLSD